MRDVSETLTPATVKDAIVRLARDFSIEITPREIDALGNLRRYLSPGTSIYLTRLPKLDIAETIRAARVVHEQGFAPVAHLTARSTRDLHELERQVQALEAAGVREVLLIAGSQAEAIGEFDSTMQLLETGIFEQHGIRRIGVAGHPEGHPAVSADVLDATLAQKNALAIQKQLNLYLVTQFFFDAQPVIAWERRIREKGNRLPVYVGFHGLTSAAGLLKYAVACGIGTSIKALSQHANPLALASHRSPERLLVDIASATAEDAASRFARAHFFPLGGFARTAAWANALSEGRFEVRRDFSLDVRV